MLNNPLPYFTSNYETTLTSDARILITSLANIVKLLTVKMEDNILMAPVNVQMVTVFCIFVKQETVHVKF